jgi:AraC-like DNA-binding protein
MEITFNFISLVHLIAVAFGFVSALVILYFAKRTNPANIPLGIAQLCISLGVFVSFSIVSKLIIYWPFWYRTGQIFNLTLIAMTFLHTLFYTKNRSWKWYDLLHAIPLLIYLVDYWDVFWLPSSQKLELILKEINNLDLLLGFYQSKYFGPHFHLQFRTFLYSGYWAAQVVIFARWLQKEGSLSAKDKVWRNWMLVFLGCQFFFWFPYFLGFYWLDILTTFQIVNAMTVFWLLISSISLFFFPSVLYGGIAKSDLKKNNVKHKAQLTNVEEKKLKELMHIIEDRIEKNKLFLKAGYGLHEFSKDIGIPVYQISKSITHHFGMGFIDFINQKRIHYCVQKLESGNWKNYKMEAIAYECGFNNRNSFTNAFKKFKGVSPSEYKGGPDSLPAAK